MISGLKVESLPMHVELVEENDDEDDYPRRSGRGGRYRRQGMDRRPIRK